MENRNDDINYKAMFSESSTDVFCPQTAVESNVNQAKINQTPEEFVIDDNIIHTQESADLDMTSQERVEEDQIVMDKEAITVVPLVGMACQGEITIEHTRIDNGVTGVNLDMVMGTQETVADIKSMAIHDETTQDQIAANQILNADDNTGMVHISSDDDIVANDDDKNVKERRRSERLKKYTNIHTMNKATKMAQKCNLEGNSKNQNSFSLFLLRKLLLFMLIWVLLLTMMILILLLC
jgi:hypothetical protein